MLAKKDFGHAAATLLQALELDPANKTLAEEQAAADRCVSFLPHSPRPAASLFYHTPHTNAIRSPPLEFGG